MSQAPSGNLLFPRMRTIRCSRVNKPRDMKMNGDMMRMYSNNVHRLTAAATALMLMEVLEGLGTV